MRQKWHPITSSLGLLSRKTTRRRGSSLATTTTTTRRNHHLFCTSQIILFYCYCWLLFSTTMTNVLPVCSGWSPPLFLSSTSTTRRRQQQPPQQHAKKRKQTNNATPSLPPPPPSSSRKKNHHERTNEPQRSSSSQPQRQQQRGGGGKPSSSSPSSPPSSEIVAADEPPRSLGQAVERATTAETLLVAAAAYGWLPTDSNLASHLRCQKAHHEKRQTGSAALLEKLGNVLRQQTAAAGADASLWSDARLVRAVWGAALPFCAPPGDGTEEPTAAATESTVKERRAVRDALMGLHTAMGKVPPPPSLSATAVDATDAPPTLDDAVLLLLHRAETMARELSLREAIEMRWAARGILARWPRLLESRLLSSFDNNAPTLTATLQQRLAAALPQLERRVTALPFDILPAGLDPTAMTLNDTVEKDHHQQRGDYHQGQGDSNVMTVLRASIPFSFDGITTRSGTRVAERRGTAWVAQDGIGALAYSGKLMPPHPVPTAVEAAMRQVEDALDLFPGRASSSASDARQDHQRPTFFDCALCNYYPDSEAACKFHTDPEHGTMWDRLTCVVAMGDARRFAFRPIPERSSWGAWDDNGSRLDTSGSNKSKASSDNDPAVIYLFPGDIVQMKGTCNDDFHHAVYPASSGALPQDEMEGAPAAPMTGGRISLVLKRAMARGSKQRRGHGRAGEGRRSRRQRARAGPTL